MVVVEVVVVVVVKTCFPFFSFFLLWMRSSVGVLEVGESARGKEME